MTVMKKLYSRVALAVVALPLIFLFVYRLTFARFLLFNLACVAGSFVGAVEVRDLFEKRATPTFRWMAPALGASLPAASYLETLDVIGEPHLLLWIAAASGLLLLRGIWLNNREDLQALLARLAASMVVMLYPGLFLLFLCRIAALPNASYHLLCLLAMVFANDTAAWGVGSLVGTPLSLVISPSKSLAGFLAGFVVSVAIAGATAAIAPGLLPGGTPGALLIGAAVGLAAILGDLVESALKRSAGVKDSGTIMMGRGGVLDSADSLLLAAPLYYLAVASLGL